MRGLSKRELRLVAKLRIMRSNRQSYRPSGTEPLGNQIPRHFVPGYLHCVPPGQKSSVFRKSARTHWPKARNLSSNVSVSGKPPRPVGSLAPPGVRRSHNHLTKKRAPVSDPQSVVIANAITALWQQSSLNLSQIVEVEHLLSPPQ